MTQTLTTSALETSVLKSRLLTADQLQDVVDRNPSVVGDSRALGRRLVDAELITEWQLKKLRSGKHSGFYLGPYKLLSHLARGGMSSLYRAEHRITGHRRALKVLSPLKAEKNSFLPRFIREAEVASKLRHRNIVRVYDLLTAKQGKAELHFIVMQLLNGRDLYRVVSEDGPLTIRQSVDLIRQAANGLQHSHNAGLVHRDVKPGNLFLTDEGSLKVVDLGLAAVLENQEESLTRLCDERILGTADYLAPEQAIDSHRADHRADVYGLACTWYYLLSGHPPFNQGPLAQRILAHQTKAPVDIREIRADVPAELAELLKAMLIKRRALRVQSCADVASRLERWLTANIRDPQFDEDPDFVSAKEPVVGRKLKRIKAKKSVSATETPTDSLFGGDTRTIQGLDSARAEARLRKSATSDEEINGPRPEPRLSLTGVSHSVAVPPSEPLRLFSPACEEDLAELHEVEARPELQESRSATDPQVQAESSESATPAPHGDVDSASSVTRPTTVDRIGPPAVATIAVASVLVLATDASVWRQARHLLLYCW